MEIREGNRVLVNLAPFIGSAAPSKQSIACRVIAVSGEVVEVATEPPYRSVTLRMPRTWIDAKSENGLVGAL